MPKSKLAELLMKNNDGDGPELMVMPPDDEIGIYETFTHPDSQGYGWIRDRIVIHAQEGPGGAEPVTVSVNGFRVDIPRDIECDIARPFTENLRNTVETRFEYKEIDGKQVTVPRNVPRFHWELRKEGVNLPQLKTKLRQIIEEHNAKVKQEWEAKKNGNNT